MINKYYRYSDTLVVRNPIYKISACLQNTHPSDLIREQMKSVFFRNAILLASAAFYKQLNDYLDGNLSSEKLKNKIEITFMKYLTRMSTRCTPFGFFSTVSTTKLSETRVPNPDVNNIQLHLRLEMSLLEHIVQTIVKNHQEFISYTVNNTLIRSEGDYSFIKYYNFKEKRIHEAVNMEGNAYLDLLFQHKNSDLKIEDIAELFQAVDYAVSGDEIRDFIDDLIELKILIHNLEIQVTGKYFQPRIKDFVNELLLKSDRNHEQLLAIHQILSLTENLTINCDLNEIRNTLIGVLTANNIPFDENSLFYSNIYREVPEIPDLDKNVIKDVIKGLDILCHYSLKIENENLKEFKIAFTDTFGSSFIPLTDVLDPMKGLGYPINKHKINETNQLLQEVTLSAKNTSEWVDRKYHKKNHRFWFDKYITCVSNGSNEIVIDDVDFSGFQSKADQLPDTFSCSFSLIRNPEDPLNKNYTIRFNGWGGSSAINYLARFAADHDDIMHICEEAAAIEENLLAEDEILAEICHIPDSRIGDILSHRGFRKYEIPYLVNASVSSPFRINISDILVGVVENKLILYSARHKKTIKPILSNAHNHRLSEHPIYKLFCEMQKENYISGPHIEFGWWSDEVSFFPKISYKNLILVQRSWTLKRGYFDAYFSGQESFAAAKERFLHLPGMVKAFVVGEGDNELYVNTDNANHWKMFLDFMSKRKSGRAVLKEFNYKEGTAYSNEIILSLFKRT